VGWNIFTRTAQTSDKKKQISVTRFGPIIAGKLVHQDLGEGRVWPEGLTLVRERASGERPRSFALDKYGGLPACQS
jgi:hypothetical protein